MDLISFDDAMIMFDNKCDKDKAQILVDSNSKCIEVNFNDNVFRLLFGHEKFQVLCLGNISIDVANEVVNILSNYILNKGYKRYNVFYNTKSNDCYYFFVQHV